MSIYLYILVGLALCVSVAINMWFYFQYKNILIILVEQTKKDWAYLATGKSGNRALEKNWLRIMQNMFETFQRKQHDYGPAAAVHGGFEGIVIRTGDKASRLWQLVVKNKSNLVDEGVDDTLLDMANYAIIAVLLRRGLWANETDNFPFSKTALIDVLKELTNED